MPHPLGGRPAAADVVVEQVVVAVAKVQHFEVALAAVGVAELVALAAAEARQHCCQQGQHPPREHRQLGLGPAAAAVVLAVVEDVVGKDSWSLHSGLAAVSV